MEGGARYHLCFAYVPPGGSDPSTQYGGSTVSNGNTAWNRDSIAS